MGRILFKQPNELYGIYSTNSDTIIAYNMTKEEYIEEMVSQYREELEEMFETEHTERLANTNYAKIKSKDYLPKNIMPYHWGEETFNSHIEIFREMGYSQEYLDDLTERWKEVKRGLEALEKVMLVTTRAGNVLKELVEAITKELQEVEDSVTRTKKS